MPGSQDFSYLREVAAKYGTLYLVSDFDAFLQKADAQQLHDLAAAYDAIRQREDAYLLSRWIGHGSRATPGADYREMTFARQAGQLLVLFDFLADHGIAPFASREVAYVAISRQPRWENLPAELAYLQGPADTYGRHTTEQAMVQFLDGASRADMEALTRIAETIKRHEHLATIEDWLRRHPFDRHQEAWYVYCLLGVLDHAGLL